MEKLFKELLEDKFGKPVSDLVYQQKKSFSFFNIQRYEVTAFLDTGDKVGCSISFWKQSKEELS